VLELAAKVNSLKYVLEAMRALLNSGRDGKFIGTNLLAVWLWLLPCTPWRPLLRMCVPAGYRVCHLHFNGRIKEEVVWSLSTPSPPILSIGTLYKKVDCRWLE
jgi:hypothetical protein